MLDPKSEKRLQAIAKTFRFRSPDQLVKFVLKRFVADDELQNRFIEELVTEGETTNDPELKQYYNDLKRSFELDAQADLLDEEPTPNEPLQEEQVNDKDYQTYQVGDKTYIADDVEKDYMGDVVYKVPQPKLIVDEWDNDENTIQAAQTKVKQLEGQAKQAYSRYTVAGDWGSDEDDHAAAVQKLNALQQKHFGGTK